jgi:outer membrane protein TolC
MKQKILIISLLLIFPFFALHAQETFDLKRSIETGLERNFQIKMARNVQQISDNNATLGNAGFLPTLDLTGGHSGAINSATRFREDGSTNSFTNAQNQTWNAGLSLNWMLFNGFSVLTNYERLRELQTMGELNTRLAIENLIANITTEYYNYVQQTIRKRNLQSAVRLSAERLRIVEARYEIGNLSRLDLQQARVDFNSDSSRLIRQQEVLFASRVRLNQLMALDDLDSFLIPADSAIVANTLLNRENLWENTLQTNTFLLLAERDKRLSVLDLRTAQSRNLPFLRFNAGYGYSHNTNELAVFTREERLGFNYGLTLGFNLFDGMNRPRQQRNARLQIENRELQLRELQLSIQSDFANVWMAYQNNIGLTALEEQNLLVAIENYEIAMERYKLGDLSGIELREAQNSLLSAEERLVQAQFNTKLCEISLLLISGQITDFLE